MFSLLLENVELNGPLPVTPMDVAVGDREGTMRLVVDAGFGDVPLPGSRPAGDGLGRRFASRRSTRSRDHRLAPLDFLKLDVEGEYRALRGGRALLEASDGLVIMFESDAQWCARAGHRREDVFDLLGRSGSRSTRGRAVPAVGGLVHATCSRGTCSGPRGTSAYCRFQLTASHLSESRRRGGRPGHVRGLTPAVAARAGGVRAAFPTGLDPAGGAGFHRTREPRPGSDPAGFRVRGRGPAGRRPGSDPGQA